MSICGLVYVNQDFLSFSHMIMIIVCDVKICVCTAATLLFVNTGTNRVTSVDTLI